jgi:uncharacterized membrane protein YciS (DUF1049 family)
VGDVCFSPQAVAVLGAIGGVVQGVICALFWGWIRSLTKRAERAESRVDRMEEQRDRAAANFEEALQVGSKAAQLAATRRAR